MENLTLIIITGYSGSGKSTALAALEDFGFYCVDNLPVELLPKFLELPIEKSSEITGLAFVMDLRERSFLSKYPSVFDEIRRKGCVFKILFLEAEEEILLQRYSQTRRQHPLAKDKTLLEGIRTEHIQLGELRKAADRIINTSYYNIHELKTTILDMVKSSMAAATVNIHILSFGFKYGIPHSADLIIDVRFIANPYFVPELKALDGKDEAVKAYVLNHKETEVFLKKYLDLLTFLIPLYEKEGKSYLTVAVGCTGGRHRSIVIAEFIFEHIRQSGRPVGITHRDIGR